MKNKNIATVAAVAAVLVMAVAVALSGIEVTATFWALVPPIVAIGLALITKEVYSSLFIGIKSAKLLAEYAKKISDLPTFITGDFNMFPCFPAYAEMVKSFTDVNAKIAGYTGNTFHNFGTEADARGPIDYCFINDKVTPLSFRVITETVNGFYPSDHYGLEIELEV